MPLSCRVEILLEFGESSYTFCRRCPIFNSIHFTHNIFQAGRVALNVQSLRETTMKKRNSFESGFSLIEVIIAAAIFSTGLGGLSLLLLTAVMGTAEASHQTIASTRASSLADMIAMNSAASGHYINPLPGAEPCTVGDDCSSEQLAFADIDHWLEELARELPRGSGLVCRDSTPDDGHSADPACDGTGNLVVKVFWMELRHQGDEDGGLRRLVARLPH
jgi:type IV pilus assembly protein PilV